MTDQRENIIPANANSVGEGLVPSRFPGKGLFPAGARTGLRPVPAPLCHSRERGNPDLAAQRWIPDRVGNDKGAVGQGLFDVGGGNFAAGHCLFAVGHKLFIGNDRNFAVIAITFAVVKTIFSVRARIFKDCDRIFGGLGTNFAVRDGIFKMPITAAKIVSRTTDFLPKEAE